MNSPKLTTDSNASSSTIGYFENRWVNRDSIRISIDDVGFRSGATVVERFRTYHRAVFELDAHLERWQQSVQAVGISGLPDAHEIKRLVSELLERNSRWLAAQANQDCGLTMFATPGELGANQPTFALHVQSIDAARVERFRTSGQPLVGSSVTQQPASMWPRAIKVRSRLHYHLADAAAKQLDRDAVAVLCDDDGTVTETSIANLAIVRGGAIHSPLASQVLGGVTQQVVERLAQTLGIAWHHRRIAFAELHQADDVLLMGTDNGVWFANRVDEHTPQQAGNSDVYRSLLAAFNDYV